MARIKVNGREMSGEQFKKFARRIYDEKRSEWGISSYARPDTIGKASYIARRAGHNVQSYDSRSGRWKWGA